MSAPQLSDDDIEKANPDALDQVNALIGEAEELAESEEWDAVMSLCEQAIDVCTQRLGPLHLCTLWHIKKKGAYLREQDRYADAEGVDRALLDKWEGKQPRDDLYDLSVLDVLTVLVEDLQPQEGKEDEVIAVQRQILQSIIRARGEDAGYVVRSKNKLAISLYRRGDYAEALQLHTEALATLRRSGDDVPYVAVLLDMVGLDALALGDAEKAQAMQEEAVAVAGRVCEPGDDTKIRCVVNLAQTYRKTGAPADWIQTLEALAGDRELDRVTVDLLNALGGAYCDAGRFRDAQNTYSRCLAWAEETLGHDDPFAKLCRDNYTYAATKTGDLVLASIFSSDVTGIPEQGSS